MKILVIGNVAKEHSLVKWIAASSEDKTIYAYPGNPGIREYAIIKEKETSDDVANIINIVKTENIDLVIPLTGAIIGKGATDELKKLGATVLGPAKQNFVFENLQTLRERAKRYGIKTLDKAHIVNNLDELKEVLSQFKGHPVALKRVDGEVRERFDTSNYFFAEEWAKKELETSPLLVEEFIEGLSATATILTDGKHYRLFPLACDYYKSKDDDDGAFSSGMGAVAPLAISRETRDRIGNEIVYKMLHGLENDGIDYKGFMTFHLLINSLGDVYLLQMKTRISDPSITAMLPLVKDDAIKEFRDTINGVLKKEEFETEKGLYALSVVIASKGYPEHPLTGEKVEINDVLPFMITGKDTDDVNLYFGAVKESGEDLITSGGRPFTLVVTASSIERANKKAYSLLYELTDIFKGAWWRKDIGTNFFLY